MFISFKLLTLRHHQLFTIFSIFNDAFIPVQVMTTEYFLRIVWLIDNLLKFPTYIPAINVDF